METRPSDNEILGLYEWAGKGTQRGNEDEEVDVIAVQGLGASPYYTWVKRVPKGPGSQEVKEVMWLRDLLPSYVGNARIATFSYLSDWYTYRRGVKTNIRELGEQLLNALHQDRQRIGALVLASNRPDRDDIKRSTVAIIFLGTPHGGTDIAGYGAYIAKLRGNDASLVESLKPSGKELYALAIDFAAGYQTLPVMCFYEKMQQTYAGGFVKVEAIEQRSAVREGKDMMYLLTDHSGLNKFSGHEDPNFKSVYLVIVEMAKNASQTVRQNYEEARQTEATIVVPFERDEDFVGREDILEKLSNMFSESKYLHRVALQGLGGVGKSQIAIEYAYRLRKECPKTWIFWVNAGSSARFELSYRAIAAAVKLPGGDEPKTDILGLVFRWLESDDSGDWLMILDNADDASVFFSQCGAEVPQMGEQMQHTTALSAYLPQNSRGSILVTSRNRDAGFRLGGREDRIVKVERMGEADSKALLRKKLPNDQSTEDEWKGLVEALECLPLAITQAAAYIAVKAPGMTISKYLRYFRHNEKHQVSLLSKDGGDLRRDPEVPNAVVITWQISFDQIKKQNLPAADLLSRMCVLDRQGIPRFLFCQDDDSDALDFEDAIGTLIAFSFVAAEKDGDIFQMHPLVQLSTKKWLEAHGEIEKRKEDVLSLLSDKFPNGEHANWKICEALEPHTRTVLGYLYTPQRCRLERAEILHNSASYARARGNYGRAGDRIKEAIDAREELLGRDNPKTLSSLGLLVSVLNGQGWWKKAEELAVQVMETSKRVLGEEHPDTLKSIQKLSLTYWNQGRSKEAEELEGQVMKTRKRLLGEEHLDTLSSMANLASTYRNQRRLEEAEKLDVQVMKTRKRILGEEHPDMLSSMANLALTYRSQGRWKEAEELEVQVMETSKRVLGEEHPATLVSMNNLAGTWKFQGRHNEAVKLLTECAEVMKDKLGTNHPHAKAVLKTLGHWQSSFPSSADRAPIYNLLLIVTLCLFITLLNIVQTI